MNTIAIILIVVAILVALPLLLALFIKKEYTIRREIVIDKSTDEVFKYIKFLKNQDYYSKWVMTDPNMKKEFKGTDGTVGFIYAWDSTNKNAGKGEQEIVRLIERELLDIEVRFIKPFEAIAKTPFMTESVSAHQTKVTWGMTGKSKYPMNLMNPFMDNLLGKDLQNSLSKLKNILEK